MFFPSGDQIAPSAPVEMFVTWCGWPSSPPLSGVNSHIQICVGSVAFDVQIKPFAVRRKPGPLLMVWRLIQPARFAAGRRHDPEMRDFRVRLQIDVDRVEHDPFSIRRRHRRADPFEFHHVLESEWLFAGKDSGR